MDFSWSKTQQKLKKSVIQFAQETLQADLLTLDQQQQFNREDWQKCSTFGVQGWPIPTAYGGQGLDTLSTVHALEGLGYGCRDNGLIFAINAHIWACQMPLLAFGTEAQKAHYLPLLSQGTWLGGHAASEPEAGSDVYSLSTTAEKQGEQYVLNGHKHYVTNGPIADLFIVFATLDKTLGQQGLSAFLVEKDTPGLSIGQPVSKMGLRTAQMGELTFTHCAIPLQQRLGKEGAGVTIFSHSMAWERSFILSSAIGTMERLIADSLRYARQRQQFGQAIGKFQMVANRLVDMKMRLETAKAHLHKVAWLKQQGKLALLEAAITKLYISEAWVDTCMDAIQIHGGQGYLTQNGLERELRDAMGSKLYSGTSEIQRVLIAQGMGL